VFVATEAAWERQPDQVIAGALVKAAADLVSVAHAVLKEAGDIRVFTQAQAAADRALSVAGDLGWSADRGVILQRRGSMVLDCYTAERSASNYKGEFQHWVEKAVNRGDPGLLQVMSSPVGRPASGAPQAHWPTPLGEPAASALFEERKLRVRSAL
jgi:hypothetical protein